MTYTIPFPSRPPFSSPHLPLILISLEDWALVTLHGSDAVKYLQSQVTADISVVREEHHVLCGHCDAKGKMWSTLRLFHCRGGFAYLVRRSVLDIQLKAMKKYATFFRVTILANNDLVLLGVAGLQGRSALEGIFTTLPDTQRQVVQEGDATILHFTDPAERFLLIANNSVANQVMTELHNRAAFNNSRQWLTLDIEAGYPIIDNINNKPYLIPQAANLQALQGISFNKGCYIGQEMVARAKFRGANKRSLYWLEGKSVRPMTPKEDVELQLGEHWVRAGAVLASSTLADGRLWVQVVMNSNLHSISKFRIREDPTSQLTIKPLPYKL